MGGLATNNHPEPQVAGAVVHILIVDDDLDVCRILETHFKRRGHTSEFMNSGFGVTNRVAGRAGSGTPPDLVVLDYMMPGLSGDKVLSVLAADAQARDVPVILYSAADTRTLDDFARIHPNCTVIQKGAGAKILVTAVEDIMAKRRARK